jgi:hypothetical protein
MTRVHLTDFQKVRLDEAFGKPAEVSPALGLEEDLTLTSFLRKAAAEESALDPTGDFAFSPSVSDSSGSSEPWAELTGPGNAEPTSVIPLP